LDGCHPQILPLLVQQAPAAVSLLGQVLVVEPHHKWQDLNRHQARVLLGEWGLMAWQHP